MDDIISNNFSNETANVILYILDHVPIFINNKINFPKETSENESIQGYNLKIELFPLKGSN